MNEFVIIKSVQAHLIEQAREQSTGIAFEDATADTSHAALERRTLATALAELEVALGDSVAIYLPNSVRWVEAALAVVHRGAMIVPISYA